MDLNYLFYRQQIERSLAESAGSKEARKTHADLARQYEEKISSARNAPRASIHDPVAGAEFAEVPVVNPTMAVAMTARELRA
jgi:hypothetical protein